MAFHPDGKRIYGAVSGKPTKHILVFDLDVSSSTWIPREASTAFASTKTGIVDMSISSDGILLAACCSEDCCVHVFSLAPTGEGTLLFTTTREQERLVAIDLIKDPGHVRPAVRVIFTSDTPASYVLSLSEDGKLCVWDAASGVHKQSLQVTSTQSAATVTAFTHLTKLPRLLIGLANEFQVLSAIDEAAIAVLSPSVVPTEVIQLFLA